MTGTVLEIATFAGASSLPLFVAAERGHFERAGLDVRLTIVKSSDQLMSGLLDGTFGVGHAAPDNFIAWRDRTGTDILAWVGGTGGPLALVGASDVPDLETLRGGSVAVDSPESGFVSMLRLLLRAAGIPETEVRLEAVGATSLRYRALVAGETSATMLSLPWSLLAVEAGCHVLGEQADVIPRLQGSCGGSLAAWLAANADVADAYLRALVAALTDLYTGSMPPDAVRRVLAERYEIDDRHAETVRRALVDPARGWPPSALIDAEGMEALCRLRRESGRPPKDPATSYYTFAPYARLFGAVDGTRR